MLYQLQTYAQISMIYYTDGLDQYGYDHVAETVLLNRGSSDQ